MHCHWQKNLAETTVLEDDESRKLVRNVQDNNVRWMIEGRKNVEKVIRDWDAKQPKRRSAPSICAYEKKVKEDL